MTRSSSKVDRPVTDLLAATLDGRDITRGFVEHLDFLVPEDHVLRERARGDLEVYERLLEDDQIAATFEQRRLSVVAHEWVVEPASEDTADIEAADWLRECLKGANYDEATRQMLSAVLLGFAVAECDWQVRADGRVWLNRLLVRRQKRFRFSPSGDLLLLTNANPRGERMPERKFWVTRMGAEHADDPYGRGIAGRLYWPAFFKRHGLKFWMSFLDKFGSPTAVATLPSGASEADRKAALDLVSGIQRSTGAVVPEGVALSLLESARAAGGDFGAFCDRMDAAISKVVLGQTMTTDDGSSLAQSKTHLSVRDQMLKADADALCESFNSQVVTWLTEWNFPRARPPKVWRRFEAVEDLAARAQRDATLAQLGFRPTLDEVREVYGGEWEEAPAGSGSTLSALQAPSDASGFSFSEPDPAEADRIADRLGDESSDLLSGLMAKVREAIDGAGSLDEVRARLESLSADLDASPDLVALIQQALVAAELRGRFEVADDLGLTRGA